MIVEKSSIATLVLYRYTFRWRVTAAQGAAPRLGEAAIRRGTLRTIPVAAGTKRRSESLVYDSSGEVRIARHNVTLAARNHAKFRIAGGGGRWKREAAGIDVRLTDQTLSCKPHSRASGRAARRLPRGKKGSA